jgi:glycerol-3-phosphate acyltransferase PlsY
VLIYLKVIVVLIVSYIIGAIPTSWILAKQNGVDLLSSGSGNPGATNVQRLLGWRLGIISLILDILKGLLPVIIARAFNQSQNVCLLAALIAITGHCYSLFFLIKLGKITGGRGVATSLGAFIALFPFWQIITILAIFIVILYATRYLALSVLASVVSLLFLQLILLVLSSTSINYVIFCVLVTLLLFIRHENHIRNLLAGKEAKFSISRNNGQKFTSGGQHYEEYFNRRVAEIIKLLKLEPGFTLDQLKQKTENYIGKKIEFSPLNMPGNITGFCLLGNKYHILYDQRVSPLHQTQIILHEIAHILLKHENPNPPAEIKVLIESLLNAQYINIGDTGNLLLRSSYNRVEDQEAESLALRLLQDINLEMVVENDPLSNIQLN